MATQRPMEEDDDRPPLPARPLLQRAESPTNAELERPSSTHLKRSFGVVVNCIIYAALAIAAWTITCVTARRPINCHSYSYDRDWDEKHTGKLNYGDANGSCWVVESENYVKISKIMQAIVAVLTIPLTSAVCSQAAVVYLQRAGQRARGPTLRQAITLADKSWTEPLVVLKMFFRWNWKRKGSRFFALAVFLTLLGSVISPLTAIMVSYKTKQLPLTIDSLAQISDLYTAINGTQADSQYFMTSLRNKLASTKRTDAQSRLWSDTGDCNQERILRGHAKCEATFQSTLFELAYLADPFWAHPVVNFNTGGMTQFTPRLNSTTMYEVLDDEALPANCAPNTDTLYIHYANSWYNATFCVPGSLSRSPWRLQRSRQDFTEELYIRASFGGEREYAAKIELDTTAGYFELPSYVRKSAGPLLQEDPVKKCNETRRCAFQWDSGTTKANGDASHTDASPKTSNKGPLVTLALALFGPGSIMDDKVELATGGSTETCAQGVPLATFFDSVSPCFDASSSDRIGESRASFLRNFLKTDKGDGTVKIAIDAAAFLVHDAWMTSTPGDFRLSRLLGVDVSAPELSDTNMIILSVLLGFYLSCLFAMSIFSALTPRWTDKLDSFAMLRIGAARPRSFPLMVSYRVDHVEALDKAPGWVGDKTDYKGEDEEHVCELGLGEKPPLRKGVRYRCYYHDDQMPMPPKEGK